jgi:glucoside 3-dehydrogenase (cytochrome c) hitch-hiker subunit
MAFEMGRMIGTDRGPGNEITRRSLLRLGAILGVCLAFPQAATAVEAFNAGDEALIADVAEIIIPATDTGGAKAAGVPAFITKMVGEWFEQSERDNFVRGLRAFDAAAISRYGKRFLSLAGNDRVAHVEAELRRAEAPQSAGLDRPRSPFILLMKRLTLFGYYTSEVGASVELMLNLVPGEFIPSADVSAGIRDDSTMLTQAVPFSAY